MKRVRIVAVFVALIALAGLMACSESKTTSQSVPLSPTGGTSAPGPGAITVSLGAPVPQSPGNDSQTSNLRPTLTVSNATASHPDGTRTYEFQISDRADFSVMGQTFSAYFAVVVSRAGIPEGAGGTTSFTPDVDLQPATRMYWRARAIQGSTVSPWSTTWSFLTRIAGYNRPGELYDPLVYGETIGQRVGDTSFVSGRGIRIGNANSWVKYQLAQTITSGEFSVDVEGLAPNNPGAKARIFSMMDGGDILFNSNYLFNVQYRGAAGNPDNAISWKALFGNGAVKLEPDFAQRSAGVRNLVATQTYHWKATWGGDFRLQVFEGGVTVMGALGATIYDMSMSTGGAAYNPSPHTAYLGANDAAYESGSFPGAVYRNVWIGNRPRPASLGSALDPKPIVQ